MVADKLIIDGVSFDVPDEDDWELGELAEYGRLIEQWGDMGAMIALVYIVKHRADPSFTVEQAQRIKVGQVDEQPDTEADADPLALTPTSTSESRTPNGSSTNDPSATPVGSGTQ